MKGKLAFAVCRITLCFKSLMLLKKTKVSKENVGPDLTNTDSF